MEAILRAESGLNPNAKGWNCIYGQKSMACKVEDRPKAWSVDCGIAQINVRGLDCPAHLFDMTQNLLIAKDRFYKKGCKEWSACKNGSYKLYLNN